METSSKYNFNGVNSRYPGENPPFNEDTAETTADYADDQESHSIEEEEEEKPGSGGIGKVIAIAVLALMLAASLGGGYYLYDENETLKLAQNQEQVRIDTLTAVKAQVEKQLEETKAMVSNYQSESENVRILLETANEEIDKKQRRINKLYKDKASVKEFQTQLAEAKTLNETLQAQIQALSEELTQVKAENVTLKETITTLQTDKKSLSEKIQLSSALQAHSVKVESMTRRKKDKFEFTEKAKRTNRIAISFEIAENKLAAAGVRNLHVLIYTPTGDILGGGSDKFTIQPEGKESAFTRNKEVNYPEEGGKVFFNWDETAEYSKGPYRVELYCDGKMIGQSQIELK